MTDPTHAAPASGSGSGAAQSPERPVEAADERTTVDAAAAQPEAPEYGEYATPAEQAAAAGRPWHPPTASERLPEPGATRAIPVGPPPATPQSAPLEDRVEAQDAAARGEAPAPGVLAPDLPARRPWDSWLTILLLLAQGWNLTSSIEALPDITSWFTRQFSAYVPGYVFGGADWVQPLAWVLLGFEAAALGFSLWAALARLRSGRLSFWVPLVVGFAVGVVSVVVFGAMLSSDPAFAQVTDAILNGALPTPSATPTP